MIPGLLEKNNLFPLNSDDFKSMEMKASFVNTTSKMSPPKGPEVAPVVVQLSDRSFALEVPAKTCAGGHNLMITIEVKNVNREDVSKKVRFVCTAKVISMLPLSKERERIIVNLMQYDEKSWTEFRGVFESRQHEINQFIESCRGF
jgi:hypothetical protein